MKKKVKVFIPDTSLEVEGYNYRGRGFESYLVQLSDEIADLDSIMLWDNEGDSVYHLMVSLLEYNYPVEPNCVECYYFEVNKETFEVCPESDISLPESIPNLKILSKMALNLIVFVSKVIPKYSVDLILLGSGSGKFIGTAKNRGVELFDTEETSRCRNIVYISV